MNYQGIKCYDVVCGSSIGGWTDREMIASMLEYLDTLRDGDRYWQEWRELATTPDEDLDPKDWEELFEDVEHLLPPFTYFGWENNEYLVLPNLAELNLSIQDGDIRTGDELPELPTTCERNDLFAVVNDHGNLTLCESRDFAEKPAEWVEIWSVV